VYEFAVALGVRGAKLRVEESMRGEDVRKIFESILPDAVLVELARAHKLQERERKLDVVRLVRAMVIAAATGYGGRQADVLRAYVQLGAEDLVRGAFYARFGEALENVMKAVSELALRYASECVRDLPGWLGEHVTDWHIVDSTTVKLHKNLLSEYQGTGDYAALKVHKRFSVGVGTTVGYHISSAREHDNLHLNVDASWKGLGLLADLGYASFKLIADCNQHGVRFVIRLKDSWRPKVQHVARASLTKTFLKGSDLNAMLADGTLLLDGRVFDLDVTFGQGSRVVSCRLVGIPVPDMDGGYCFYLSNLPRKVGPRQIADLYRVRWEIESDNKLDKSCSRLDEIGAQSGPAVRALVHASIVSSMLACLLAHHHRVHETVPPEAGAERTVAPIHPQSLLRMMGAASSSIATALALTGPAAVAEWDRIAGYLEHLGKDPNWRRSPSILDQLRGWAITPGRPRNAKLASAQKTAAN
jgi:putative transposase